MNHRIISLSFQKSERKKKQQQCNKTKIDQCMDKNFLVELAINVNCKIKECPCKNKGDFYELFQKDTASCKLGWYINRYPISEPHYYTVTI